MTPREVVGVDFSGAKLAGRNIWLARLDVRHRRPRLVELACLEKLAGRPDRPAALATLVDLVLASERALWGIDFPFGLPLEVPGLPWQKQFDWLRPFGDDAYAAGLACVRFARENGLPTHVRRATDIEAKTPFDCYHYRIVYQMFFGITAVLAPLRQDAGTAILPFQYEKWAGAARIVVETCPSSSLKRLGLPHQNYKQPAGGPLMPRRRSVRRILLDALDGKVEISDTQRRTMMRNPGGDAIDAVVAAVGTWDGYRSADHMAIAAHPRYPLEGRLYI
jgi:hypothetical protein